MSRFQSAWFGVEAQQGRIGDAVASKEQGEEETTWTGLDYVISVRVQVRVQATYTNNDDLAVIL